MQAYLRAPDRGGWWSVGHGGATEPRPGSHLPPAGGKTAKGYPEYCGGAREPHHTEHPESERGGRLTLSTGSEVRGLQSPGGAAQRLQMSALPAWFLRGPREVGVWGGVTWPAPNPPHQHYCGDSRTGGQIRCRTPHKICISDYQQITSSDKCVPRHTCPKKVFTVYPELEFT